MVTRKVKYENSLEYFSQVNNMNYLLDEFSSKNELLPREVSTGNTKPVWWICPECNSEYDMGTYYRTKMKCNCPYCAGKRVNHTNSLADNNPLISLEWNYSKNSGITPKEFTHSSSKKVWWLCSKGHEWKTAINNRTNNGNGCPYCAGRKVGNDNNLTLTHPQICIDWDFEKNVKNPASVSWSNKEVVWWKCTEGHTYKKSTYDKVRFPDCPKCNSIAVKRPDLMIEWDFERNKVNPLEISFSSGKKVVWVCANDSTHIWQASPHKRNNGRGCPICAESKGEKRIRKYLDSNCVSYESQKEYSELFGIGGGNLSYDFYLPIQNVLIEYQGEFHDGTANRQTDNEYATQKEHDKRKYKYAKENNINLLELWYWDYERIEEILHNYLFKEELNG